MGTKRQRVILLTRKYGGEFGATDSRLNSYAGALQNEGAEVIILTRFPFVYPGHQEKTRYARRLYLRERIDGVTVLRARIPGQFGLERLLDRALRLRARLRRDGGRSTMGIEVIDLLYGLLALPFIVLLRPYTVVAELGPAWLAVPLALSRRFGLGPPLLLQISDVKSLAMLRGHWGAVPAAQIDLNTRIEAVVYRHASSIVTVTEAQRAHIAAHLGTDQEEVHLIPNGAEVDLFPSIDAMEKQSYKRRLGLDGKFVALYAGTLNSSHDVQTLLAAARLLRHVPDIAFLVLGQGPVEHELRTTAAHWRLDNVTFCRPVPVAMLPPFVAAADAGISTEIGGLIDTVRSKVYLYMAGRLAVVATDDESGVRALVKRAGCGELVPPGDATAIAERLLDLKRDPARVAALGASGRRFVERHHDRAELARNFARLVLRGARPASAEWKPLGARLGEPRPEAD